MIRTVCTTTALLLVVSSSATAALAPTQKCEIAKNSAAARKVSCLTAEHDKAVAGKPSDTSRCTAAFNRAFAAAEAAAIKAGGSCPTTNDVAAIEERVDSASRGIGAALSGVHFVDNGDGTITDTRTGLQWEKKVAGQGTHGTDNTYAWTTTGPDFLAGLNNCTSADGSTVAGGFAGHCDWRLPTLAELETIIDLNAPGCSSGSPCIDPIFGPTVTDAYWSSTSMAGNPTQAWCVYFGNGNACFSGKSDDVFVRAVRGGS